MFHISSFYIFLVLFFLGGLISLLETEKEILTSLAMSVVSRKDIFLLFLITETNTVINVWAS